jgi:hypothetical protein
MANLTKDPNGNRRLAEPATLAAGWAAALWTAISTKDYATAFAIAIASGVPWVISILADVKRGG